MPSARISPPEAALRVVYELAVPAGESPEARARAVAIEQTVELGEDGTDPALPERLAGRVVKIEPAGEAVCRATLEYPAAALGADLAQVVNVLFGNVSMQAGVRIAAVEWPAGLLASLGGPRFGIEGLRRLAGDTSGRPGRPLTATALKPLGATPAELAGRAYRLARGGLDIVKDDHGLADQSPAPFGERVRRCQEAIERANAETGGRCLYFPNLTGPPADLPEKVELLRAIGVRGALVAPLLTGLDAVRSLAASSGLALLAHPALAGAFFRPGHGIAPAVLLGEVFRIAGADGVVFPLPGGRFAIPEADTDALCRDLRGPLGDLLPAFPVAGGGVGVERVAPALDRLGPDTILLVGGGLYRDPDLESAARRLVEAARSWRSRTP
jgi:S-methyl-5-thioribulose 1-phosphate isomerase